jgi:hypothetical protein
MSSQLKINIEIPAPADARQRQALTDTIKAYAQVLADKWPTLLEDEDAERPEQTSINFTAILGQDRGHKNTKIRSFTEKFGDGRTIKFTPAKT